MDVGGPLISLDTQDVPDIDRDEYGKRKPKVGECDNHGGRATPIVPGYISEA